MLKQDEYKKKLIKHFTLEEAMPASVSIQPNLNLDSNNGPELVDTEKFQSLLCALLYSNLNTRVDIFYAVNALSRFGNKQPLHITSYSKMC